MKLSTLTENKDIIALAILKEGSDEMIRTYVPTGDARRTEEAVVSESIRMLLLFKEEKFLRVVVGGNTIVVQREHGYIVAACIPTGHAVAKSLHRMIRRATKPAKIQATPRIYTDEDAWDAVLALRGRGRPVLDDNGVDVGATISRHEVFGFHHLEIDGTGDAAVGRLKPPLPDEGPHVCTGCIGDGPCEAHPPEAREHDCAGCGAPPGTRCAKDCHAWDDDGDGDFAESIDDMAITERPL